MALVWAGPPLRGNYAERVKETVLPNGLKLILLEDHKAPVVVFQIYYRVGSRNESLGHTGLSHILEHVMFKGTDKVAPEDYSKIIQRNGGRTNAWTTDDNTTYFATLASDRVGVVIDLEADRMTNLKLTDEVFLPERSVIMEERRLRVDNNPVAGLFEQLTSTAYAAHPYEFPVIGWMSDIAQATLEDALRHYRTYYIPNNAFVVAVGDFDSAALTAQIGEAFGAVPSGPPPPSVRAVEPAAARRRGASSSSAGPSFPSSPWRTTCPTCSATTPAALEVLAAVLSGGESARLHQRARLSPAPGARRRAPATTTRRSIPALFTVYAQPLPGKSRGQVEAALDRELARAAAEPPTRARAREGEERHRGAVRLRSGLALLPGDAARPVRGRRRLAAHRRLPAAHSRRHRRRRAARRASRTCSRRTAPPAC